MTSTDPTASGRGSRPMRDDALGEPFSSSVEWKHRVKIVRLSGTLVVECRGRFFEDVRSASQRPEPLVLDLRGLTFIDSAGIAMLMETEAWAREQGFACSVIRGTGQVRRSLELAGVDQALSIVDDESQLSDS